MPSDAEMTAYAKNLPDIYRDIMAAFPAIEPGRKAGYGLAFQTLAMHFANTRAGTASEKCRRLVSGWPRVGSSRSRTGSSLTRPISESN